MLDYADPTETGGNVGLVILAILLSIAAGVGVGFLLKKFLMVGLVLLAALGGAIAGYLLYNLVFIAWI